jgi:hypothetical protein
MIRVVVQPAGEIWGDFSLVSGLDDDDVACKLLLRGKKLPPDASDPPV